MRVLQFQGRHRCSLSDHGVPGAAAVLTDYDVLPADIGPNVGGADVMSIDDPLAFPWDHVDDEFWNRPLRVVLPALDFREAQLLFGKVLLERLTICDLLVASSDLEVELRRHYGFPRSMFLPADFDGAQRRWAEAARVENELQARMTVPYADWALPVAACKRGLRSVGRLAQNTLQSMPAVGRRSLILHGHSVRGLLPFMWSDLTWAVEHRAIERERLRMEYPEESVLDVASGPTRSRRVERCGVGINLLRLPSLQAGARAFGRLFDTVSPGAPIVLVETFDGRWSPSDYTDILVEAAVGRLIFERMDIVPVPSNQVATTAVFGIRKLGERS